LHVYFLPHHKDIKVGKNKIEIDESERSTSNIAPENADFVIEGDVIVNVKDKSVIYEYCSQTGLLHTSN